MNENLKAKLISVLMRVPEHFMYSAVNYASKQFQANPVFRNQDENETRANFVEFFTKDLYSKFGSTKNFEIKVAELIETLSS